MNKNYPIEDVYFDVNGEPIDWKGTSTLKKPNAKLNLTKEHISEYIKCQNDVIYFAENYVYISDPNEGLTLIKLYDYQKELLKTYFEKKRIIVLSSRQSGKSQISSIFILWYSIFYNDKTSCLLSNKEKTSLEIFSRILVSYEQLPNYLKPGCKDFSKSQLTFDNGSKIFGSSTSSTAIRGFTISGILFIDEIAFINSSIYQEFMRSIYPTISKAQDSRVIMVSTPAGLNHFFKLWSDAKKGINGYTPFRIEWDQVPGRNEEFKRKTIAQIGHFAWMQEFENSFLGSMNTLISTDIIKSLTFQNPIRTMLDGNLSIYEEPSKEDLYIIGVDTSKGVGRDYCVAQVIKVTKYPFIQVATYRCNTISPMLFIDVVLSLAQTYNNAYLVIENNAEGNEVANGIWFNKEYINMFNAEIGKNKDIGFRTTKKTKSISYTTIKNLIETHKLIINDLETINEISTYILHTTNIYAAEKDKHDDTVTALLHFCYFLRSEEFKALYKAHDLKRELFSEQIGKLEEEFKLPIFKISGGDSEQIESSENKHTKDLPKMLKNVMKKEKICLMK